MSVPPRPQPTRPTNYTALCASLLAIAAGAILASGVTAPRQPADSVEVVISQMPGAAELQ